MAKEGSREERRKSSQTKGPLEEYLDSKSIPSDLSCFPHPKSLQGKVELLFLLRQLLR